MRLMALMALRNLSRRKTRTVLTFLMISLGTALVVFSAGLGEGTYSDMIELATRSWAGHFQVTERGYQDKPSLFDTIDDVDAVTRTLLGDARVAAVTSRVETAGLISLGNKTVGAMLTGVDPVNEPLTTTMPSTVVEGGWLPAAGGSETKPMIIGVGLAKRLKATVGDEVSFVGQAADGSIAAELYTITGLTESGAAEMDAGMAFITLGDAQALLALEGRVHRVVGVLRDIKDAGRLGRGLAFTDGLEYLDWTGVLPQLHQTIESDRAGLWIFLIILVAVVVLGVANTMMMVVMERSHELGVMAALGTRPRTLLMLIIGEAAWVTGAAVVFGVMLGAAVNVVIGVYGLPVATDPISYGGVVIDVMHAENTPFAVLTAPLIILAAGVAAGALPALRAARLKPVEAMRES